MSAAIMIGGSRVRINVGAACIKPTMRGVRYETWAPLPAAAA